MSDGDDRSRRPQDLDAVSDQAWLQALGTRGGVADAVRTQVRDGLWMVDPKSVLELGPVLDLSPIYITTHYYGTRTGPGETQIQGGAVLRCEDHPEWEVDADGTALPGAIRSGRDHITDQHRLIPDAERGGAPHRG